MIEHEKRLKIRQLRSEGMTYAAICAYIGQEIPKGTLSYICKGVILPDDYYAQRKKHLRAHLTEIRQEALLVNSQKLKRRFERIHREAREVIELNDKKGSDKIHLAMLYIGEGAKYKSYRGLSMGSSDPDILRIYISLLERCYYKKREDFRARIQCRDDQDQEALKLYWAGALGISKESFYLSYSDKRTAGKPTKDSDYKGVCVISCSGADIQLELDAIARLYGQKIWGVSSFG